MLSKRLLQYKGDLADPYWPNTTLLIHGDGANNGNNATFLDSSSNNLTITPTGAPTQGTVSPFGDEWSVYLNGSSFLYATPNTAFQVGTGDFTMECWIYHTGNIGTQASLWDFRQSSTGNGCNMSIYQSKLSVWSGNATGGNGTTTLVANKWYHIAYSRTSGVAKIFLNGVQEYSGNISTDMGFTGSTFNIGCTFDADLKFPGYISNMRIIKGTGLYTTAFTPPTANLTAVSGTGVLCCQSNRFKDNSSNNLAISAVGTPQVIAFSPFTPTTSYNPTIHGGSIYVANGVSNYLETPATINWNSLGSWTVECFFNLSSASTTRQAIFAGLSDFKFGVIYGDTGATTKILYLYSSNGTTWDLGTTSNFGTKSDFVAGVWYHLAVVFTGTAYKSYINGVLDNTITSSTKIVTGSNGLRIARWGDNGYTSAFAGYISNFRVVSTALYTAEFTPPTSPLTAITNTQLLLSGTNGNIIDNKRLVNISCVADAKVSNTQSKFGTTSVYFDGTGDYITATSPANFTFGTSDFTVEFWIYSGSNSTSARILSNGVAWGANSWGIGPGEASFVDKYVFHYWNANSGGVSLLVSTTASNDNTWKHIAVTRNGNVFRLFVNGTQEATATNTAALDDGTAKTLNIGRFDASTYIVGYLDDVRITKGIARYIANFTPPTSAFNNR